MLSPRRLADVFTWVSARRVVGVGKKRRETGQTEHPLNKMETMSSAVLLQCSILK